MTSSGSPRAARRPRARRRSAAPSAAAWLARATVAAHGQPGRFHAAHLARRVVCPAGPCIAVGSYLTPTSMFTLAETTS